MKMTELLSLKGNTSPERTHIFHVGTGIDSHLLDRSRGRTYVMITYVSKENILGPDDKISYIRGRLKGPMFIL